MSNQVKFGLENVHYAVYDSSSEEYGTPVAWPGAVSLTIDPEGDTETFYADNTDYYISTTNAGYTGTFTAAYMDDDAKVALLGYEVDDNGMLVEPSDATTPTVALLYEVSGDPLKRRGVLYNVAFERPSEEANTTEDTTTPDTIDIEYTAGARSFEFDGDTRNIVRASITSDKDAYSTFFDSVLIPTKAGE